MIIYILVFVLVTLLVYHIYKEKQNKLIIDDFKDRLNIDLDSSLGMATNNQLLDELEKRHDIKFIIIIDKAIKKQKDHKIEIKIMNLTQNQIKILMAGATRYINDRFPGIFDDDDNSDEE